MPHPGGRPSEYREIYISKVDEYLATCEDEYTGIGKDGLRLKVKLPTIEGFAQYLDVSKKSLYNWRDQHEEFLHALERIELEQKQRLLNCGLSGDYNPTIAKLVLSANHGMAEKSETDITSGGKSLSELLDAAKESK